MSDKTALFLVFVVSSILLIYVEYIADDPEAVNEYDCAVLQEKGDHSMPECEDPAQQ